MFYTLPSYEFAPEGVSFEAMGAEPGTRVWRAMRLSVPKFIFVIEYTLSGQTGVIQTAFCSEVPPVLTFLAIKELESAKVYLWVPSTISTNGLMNLLPLKCILRGKYKPGFFKAAKEAFVYQVADGAKYVDQPGVPDSEVREQEIVYGAS